MSSTSQQTIGDNAVAVSEDNILADSFHVYVDAVMSVAGDNVKT